LLGHAPPIFGFTTVVKTDGQAHPAGAVYLTVSNKKSEQTKMSRRKVNSQYGAEGKRVEYYKKPLKNPLTGSIVEKNLGHASQSVGIGI